MEGEWSGVEWVDGDWSSGVQEDTILHSEQSNTNAIIRVYRVCFTD